MMCWLILICAITLEVIATSFLKMSHGFSVASYSVLSLLFYAGSLFLLSLALKTVEIGIAYAIWSGFGMVLIALIGIVFFNERIDVLKVLFFTLIIVGAVGLNLTSKSR